MSVCSVAGCWAGGKSDLVHVPQDPVVKGQVIQSPVSLPVASYLPIVHNFIITWDRFIAEFLKAEYLKKIVFGMSVKLQQSVKKEKKKKTASLSLITIWLGKEKNSLPWSTPQKPATARAGLGRNLDLGIQSRSSMPCLPVKPGVWSRAITWNQVHGYRCEHPRQSPELADWTASSSSQLLMQLH